MVFLMTFALLQRLFGHKHDQVEWRLFINTSEVSLKDALLCNGNNFLSVILAHAVNIQEPYKIIKILLDKIQYKKHNWNMCGDLRPPFAYLACSLATQSFVAFCVSGVLGPENIITYIQKQWSTRESLTPGERSVVKPH
jgi:hypothetical protein